ncbi:MAG: quinone-interacting membrane-bound oxidoreductase complex subunit QmoC [Desulfobacterales bacterium]|nr:quinone-interacting membrane-bound oxidoreductase complex subunit QmoC [Desulfobacterales bacterium]
MADSYRVEPDLKFVRQLVALGGETLKKCYQCATCSVVCPISPDERPFPRKEMIAAQWGLKDKLVGNMDVWLCHYCNDCSTYCPRGARPGDVLNAVRAYSIMEYSWPRWLGRIVVDSRFWWLLLAIPVAIYLVLLGATGHLHIPEGHIHFDKFFPTLYVDLIFVPLHMLWVPLVFGIGISRLMKDMQKNAVADGRAKRTGLNVPDFLRYIVCTLPVILGQFKFRQCTTNKDRDIAHLLVMYSFIGLFTVTGLFFVALYILQAPGPYSQVNPVKILANVSAIALFVGILLMIRNRRKEKGNMSKGGYFDWSLIILILGLVVTGGLTELTRLADWRYVCYPMYFVHLVLVFSISTYIPYCKLAHLVYRAVAMAYSRYSGREPCE